MSYRRSIRLPDYDYAQEGAYFITICIQHHEHRLGHIANDQMHLSPAGKMVLSWWQKLPEKFPDIEPGEYVVMPNHFHGIIINVGATPRGRLQDDSQNNVGATPRGRPTNEAQGHNMTHIDLGDHVGLDTVRDLGDHVGSPLREIVGWFKTMTTNDYIRNVKHNGWPRFDKRLWQRNYYEHIIRTDRAFENISAYIRENPQRWKSDRLFS